MVTWTHISLRPKWKSQKFVVSESPGLPSSEGIQGAILSIHPPIHQHSWTLYGNSLLVNGNWPFNNRQADNQLGGSLEPEVGKRGDESQLRCGVSSSFLWELLVGIPEGWSHKWGWLQDGPNPSIRQREIDWGGCTDSCSSGWKEQDQEGSSGQEWGKPSPFSVWGLWEGMQSSPLAKNQPTLGSLIIYHHLPYCVDQIPLLFQFCVPSIWDSLHIYWLRFIQTLGLCPRAVEGLVPHKWYISPSLRTAKCPPCLRVL